MPFGLARAAREGRAVSARTYGFARALSRGPDHVAGAAAVVVTVLFAVPLLTAVMGGVCWAAPVAMAAGGRTDAGLIASPGADGGRTDPPDGADIAVDAVDAVDGGVDGPMDAGVDGDGEGAIPGRAAENPGAAVSPRPATDARSPHAEAGVGSAGDDPAASVVRARRTPAASPREDLSSSATVLNPADSPRARDDLGSLLLEVPGANVTRRGGFGSFTTVSLRGSNPDEVRIYVDGVPLNQAAGGAVDLSTLPLGDVERIEVYRGSSPIVFGESALGGIISISTHTPGTANASARVGGGSFRTAFADLSAGGAVGALKLYAGVHWMHAVGDFPQAAPAVVGGYQPPRRENNDLAQWDGVLRASLALPGRRELRAGFIGVARDQGLPAEAMFHATAARASTARGLLHVGYESRDDLGAGGRVRATLFASATREAFSDPVPELVAMPTATNDLTRTVGATATAEKAVTSWARLTGVVEGRAEEYLPRNQLDPVTPAGHPATRQVATAGFELDLRWSWLRVDVLPSARLELARDVRSGRDSTLVHRAADEPVQRAHPVLRLGVLRRLGHSVSARANLGRYARIPSFVELYGYNRGVIGNAELRPERGWNADLGVVASGAAGGGTFLTSATLFGAEVEDLIGWRTYSYQTRAENITRARIWGLETELRLRRRRLALIGQATLTDARDRGDIAASRGRQIAHHPRYRAYGRVEWHQPVAALVVVAFADVDGSAGNFSTATRYGQLPARLLVGAGLAAEHLRSGLRLSVSCLNLTDARTRDFPGYPLPGRSVFASLGWSSADSRSSKTQE